MKLCIIGPNRQAITGLTRPLVKISNASNSKKYNSTKKAQFILRNVRNDDKTTE